MRHEWQVLLRAWKVDIRLADKAYDDVAKRYAEPGRFYHTLNHIQSVMQTLKTLEAQIKNRGAVKLAAWLHDVIYDSRARDNEVRSAEYAEGLCEDLAIPDGHVIARMILATKSHDAGDDGDTQALLDADLAILGSGKSVYREYALKVRQEYAWVPEPEWRVGRRQVLERFLARPKIYHYLRRLDEPARRNMNAEIASLQ